MNVLKEVASVYRYLRKTAAADRRVIFYSEHESYFAYLEGLVDALKQRLDHGFCYVTSDPDDPVLRTNDPQIHAFYLNRLLPFFMKFVGCRVFVMTLTDLEQFHLQRSINPVHYVYVFHAMNSTHMTYRHAAFDHYDSILCTGPYQIRELEADAERRSLPPRELVRAGYYRVERINRQWQAIAGATRPGTAADHSDAPKTVLLAPSWGIDNVLERHGADAVDVLLNAGFRVIVRPHPETCKRFPDTLTALDARFSSNVNFRLERSVRSDTSLLEADVLITDWSGIALEYAFGTERPVLFVDVPRKVQNDRYQELGIEPFEVGIRSQIGHIISPAAIDNLGVAVTTLINDADQFRERLITLRDENLFNFGQASEIGVNHICAQLADSAASGQP